MLCFATPYKRAKPSTRDGLGEGLINSSRRCKSSNKYLINKKSGRYPTGPALLEVIAPPSTILNGKHRKNNGKKID